MNHSFDSTNGHRRPGLQGGTAPPPTQSGPSTDTETAEVRVLSTQAHQAQPLLAARAQAQAQASSQAAQGRSPDTTSDGLSSRIHVQMLFKSGIRSGQELLRRGATIHAIAAIVLPQIQSELNTPRIQDTLPCWISGLIHGLGGPEVAQRHVQAVLTALMHDSRLPLHIQQSCLHAIALALSGQNADPGVRIAYTARGEESLQDLTGPSGAKEGLPTKGGHSEGATASERSRRPAWDGRLPPLMGGQLVPNEGHLQAWNHGMRGLYLDPLWRMDSGSQARTPHSPSSWQLEGGSGAIDALHLSTPRTAPALTSAFAMPMSTPVVVEGAAAAAQPRAGSNPASLASDEAAQNASLPASPPESDAIPLAASPPGGDSMVADSPPWESAVVSQAPQADPRGIEGPLQTLALASALRDRLAQIPDLMTAQPDRIEECLRPAEAALQDDIRVELARHLQTFNWDGVTSPGHLRQLEALIQDWRHDLAELDALVNSLEKATHAADAPSSLVGTDQVDPDPASCFAAIRQRLVTRGSFIRCLLADTRATLQIGDLELTAVVQQPSLATWLEGWAGSAFAAIPRAALIERLIERTLPTLPVMRQDASAQRPRPAEIDDDGTKLVSWFVAELQRRWALADDAIDQLARGVVGDDMMPASLGEKASSVNATRERELQALNQRYTERERLTRMRQEFNAQVTLLTGDTSGEHAIALGLISPSDQDQLRVAAGGGNKGSFTFKHLADMVETIQQYRERSAEPRQQPQHSGPSVSPLAAARAAPAASLPSPIASSDSDISEDSEASANFGILDDIEPPDTIDRPQESD